MDAWILTFIIIFATFGALILDLTWLAREYTNRISIITCMTLKSSPYSTNFGVNGFREGLSKWGIQIHAVRKGRRGRRGRIITIRAGKVDCDNKSLERGKKKLY
jgi:hypothetical protein